MQKYCDIVPDATGWIYVIDGLRSPSFYHTYDLALQAARTELARRGRPVHDVFRRQAMDGEMHPVMTRQPGLGTPAPHA